MKLSIRNSGGAPLNVELIGHIERRAGFALSRLAMYVQQVKVALTDINGPRGGVDKRCQVQVMLEGEQPMIITETSDDLIAAVNRAFSIVSALAARRIERRINSRRQLQDALRGQVPAILA